MKSGKIISMTLALLLGMAGIAQAAVPESGVYLNKDGTPVSEKDQQPPKLLSNPMAPMTAAVQNAMALLPHSGAAVIQFTVNEYGQPEDASVATSSGSVILDDYAVTSVQGWKFKSAKRGNQNVSAAVSVPVRFISTMVSLPAAATDQPMKAVPEKAAALLAGYEGGLDVPVTVHLSNEGKLEGTPEPAPWDGTTLSQEEQKLLQTYAADCVKDWTFTPAKNPDGEAIRSDMTIVVHVK